MKHQKAKNQKTKKKNSYGILSVSLVFVFLGVWYRPSSLVLRARALAGDPHTKAPNLS